MASSLSSTTTYDPASTAAQLAQAYTAARQQLLTTQTSQASSTASALTKLGSALTAFDSALSAMSDKKSVIARSASFSDTSVGTATAASNAVAGSYSFFVQQLATAGQNAYANVGSTAASGAGTLKVNLAGGSSFNVDVAGADTDGDGQVSPAELAAAINSASGNDSKVTASLITVGGQSQMVLSSSATGADSAITLDTTGMASGALQDALNNGKAVVEAKNAIVYLGDPATGLKLEQSSNTFNAITGVSMTFTKAMSAGQAPITLTVANDDSGTAANVQKFVDAYNTLQGVMSSMTFAGDPSKSQAAGIFSNDPGLRALNSHITTALRQSIGGVSLANYGISFNKDGTLSLDSTRLNTKLASNPTGLDALLGSAGIVNKTGVLGTIDKYLTSWTNSTTGQIKTRQDAVTKLQSDLTTRQSKLDDQYNSAYSRYLAQFTQLQTMQQQMTQTTNLFDALFNSSKS